MAYYGSKTYYGSGESYGTALVGGTSPLSAVCNPLSVYDDGSQETASTFNTYLVTTGTITSRAVSGGFATVTAPNTFSIGDVILQSGFTGADATSTSGMPSQGLNGIFSITDASSTYYSFALSGTVSGGPPIGTPTASATKVYTAIQAGYARIDLSWGNPNIVYNTYRVRRSRYGFPRSEFSGDLIYEATPATATRVTDTHYVPEGVTYFYRVFVQPAGSSDWHIFDQTWVEATAVGNSAAALKNALPRMYLSDYYDSDGRYVPSDSFAPPIASHPLSQFLEGVGFWVDTFKTQAKQVISAPSEMSKDLMSPLLSSYGFKYPQEMSYESQRRLLTDKWYLLTAKGTRRAISAFSSDVTGWKCTTTAPANLVPSQSDVSFTYSNLTNLQRSYVTYTSAGDGDTSADVTRGLQTASSPSGLTTSTSTFSASNFSGYSIAWVQLAGTHSGFNIAFEGSYDGASWTQLEATNATTTGYASNYTSRVVTGGTATITAAHNFVVGDVIVQAGFTGADATTTGGLPAGGLNGTFTITATTSTTFSFALTGTLAAGAPVGAPSAVLSGTNRSVANGSYVAPATSGTAGATGVLPRNQVLNYIVNVCNGFSYVRVRSAVTSGVTVSGTMTVSIIPINVGSTAVVGGTNLTLPIGKASTAQSATVATNPVWPNADTEFPNQTTKSTFNVRVLQYGNPGNGGYAWFGTNYPPFLNNGSYTGGGNIRDYEKNLVPIENGEAYNFMFALRRVTPRSGSPLLSNNYTYMHVVWYDIDKTPLLDEYVGVIANPPATDQWAYYSGLAIAPPNATHLAWKIEMYPDLLETIHIGGIHIEKVSGQLINLMKIDGNDFAPTSVATAGSITSRVVTGGTATITATNTFAVGNTVYQTGFTGADATAGLNGAFVITAASSSSYSFALAGTVTAGAPVGTPTATSSLFKLQSFWTAQTSGATSLQATGWPKLAVYSGTNYCVQMRANSSGASEMVSQKVPVVANASYRLGAYFATQTSTRNVTVTAMTTDVTGTMSASFFVDVISVPITGVSWNKTFVPSSAISVTSTTATARASSTYYLKGSVVRPATVNGGVYEAQNTGNSGSSVPSFPATAVIGGKVTDGAVTWKCIATTTAVTRDTAYMQVDISVESAAANEVTSVLQLGVVRTDDALGQFEYPIPFGKYFRPNRIQTSTGSTVIVDGAGSVAGSYKLEYAPNPYRDPRTVNIVLEPDRVNLASSSTGGFGATPSGLNVNTTTAFVTGSLFATSVTTPTFTSASGAGTLAIPWETQNAFGQYYIQPFEWYTFSLYGKILTYNPATNPNVMFRLALTFTSKPSSSAEFGVNPVNVRTYSNWVPLFDTSPHRAQVSAQVPGGVANGRAIIQIVGLPVFNSDFVYDGVQIEKGRKATDFFTYASDAANTVRGVQPTSDVSSGPTAPSVLNTNNSFQFFEKALNYHALAAQVVDNIPATTPYRLVTPDKFDWISLRKNP